MFCDLQRGGARQLIGLAGNERVECEGRVEAALLVDLGFRDRYFGLRRGRARFFRGVFRKSKDYLRRFAQILRRQPLDFRDELVLYPLENEAIRG